MEKRYQVFVSSTFTDLRDERQAVLRAVLELDHMPAGMELFPAADATAWQIIQDVIDASDYYVLVIGGRYGSLDDEGISFTEREYDYASSRKKPVIPLLHQNPDNLPRGKTETDEAAWDKLRAFRSKIEERHTCVYWSSADELKARVILGLTAAMKRTPAVGWVRADRVPSESTLGEILTLRKRVADLEAQLESSRVAPPEGSEDLVQGDDRFEIAVSFKARRRQAGYPGYEDTPYSGKLLPSWNEMFASVAPTMINEAPDESLKAALREFLSRYGTDQWKETDELKGATLRNFEFPDDKLYTIVVQFRALGLIRESQRARSVKDTRTFWTLTPYGDQLMTQLRALRRKRIVRPVGGEAQSVTEGATKNTKRKRSSKKSKPATGA